MEEKLQEEKEEGLDEAFPVEASPKEEAREEQVENKKVENNEKEEEEVVKEEPRVPYSRFKSVRERERELERENEDLRSRLNRDDDREYRPREVSNEPPSWWVKLYGDSAQSKEAWVVYQENQAPSLTKEEIREEALRAFREEQQNDSQRVEQNVETIDESLEDLEAYVGRSLTEQEQADILDIADEYTPKDENGDYLGPVFSFEKAWEVRELREKASQEPRKQSRDRVASLTGSQTRGEPSAVQLERDKKFDPRDMDAWRKNPLLNQ